MSRQLKRDSLVAKTLASLARTGGSIKARPIARPRTEAPDTATATKRVIEEFKIGEPWKEASGGPASTQNAPASLVGRMRPMGVGDRCGRNVRMDLRSTGDDINRIRALAHEVVGLQPDMIVTEGTVPTVALQRETRTIPVVFVNVGDPVTSGIVTRGMLDCHYLA